MHKAKDAIKVKVDWFALGAAYAYLPKHKRRQFLDGAGATKRTKHSRECKSGFSERAKQISDELFSVIECS